jgi:hypothetical protein
MCRVAVLPVAHGPPVKSAKLGLLFDVPPLDGKQWDGRPSFLHSVERTKETRKLPAVNGCSCLGLSNTCPQGGSMLTSVARDGQVSDNPKHFPILVSVRCRPTCWFWERRAATRAAKGRTSWWRACRRFAGAATPA